MKLYIIRHGETEWNVQKRLQGVSDTNLNEKGIEMAKQTAEALKEIPFACCFTSPLKRAKDTAMYILRDRQVPVRTPEFGKFLLENGRAENLPFCLRICWIIFFIILRYIRHQKAAKKLFRPVPEQKISGRN